MLCGIHRKTYSTAATHVVLTRNSDIRADLYHALKTAKVRISDASVDKTCSKNSASRFCLPVLSRPSGASSSAPIQFRRSARVNAVAHLRCLAEPDLVPDVFHTTSVFPSVSTASGRDGEAVCVYRRRVGRGIFRRSRSCYCPVGVSVAVIVPVFVL